jgi:hypothetical protein
MVIRAVVLLLMLLAALPVRAAQVTLTLGSIRNDVFEAEGVTLVLDAARRGEADIRLARLRLGGIEYSELGVHCSGFYFDGRRLDCPNGSVRRDDARGRDRPLLPFSLAWRANDGFLEFAMRDVDAVALSPLVRRLRSWRPTGKFDIRLAMEGEQARLTLDLRGLDFASREGDVAGKDITLSLAASAERSGAGWRWQARLDWPRGEFYRAPWRRLAGVQVEAQGTLSNEALQVELARLDVADVGAVTASLRWDRLRGEATDWGFVTEPLDLATAMRDWVQPWLSGLGLPAWRTSGHARFSAEWKAGALRRFYAGLEQATLADATGYLELSGVNAQIPWEENAATGAEISAAAGRFGDLPLGGVVFPLSMADNAATIRDLVIPMLDGRFEITELRIARGSAGWQSEFEGGIEGVSMPKLSRALRLPVMAGSLTARVPRVAYADGVLRLDGALGIEVFDGGIIVHQLRLIDPFGAGRRFVADVTARNLDLGMLTRTYAFGSIEGRFDADLHDLELHGWKPVRFDARIASSPGDYERVLSFGALQDIAALGEGQEGAAIRRAPTRAFGFGYSRIGVGCVLRDGVCLLDGVAREGDGILLMQGSGMPSVSIIGYNRRIDWESLVARIREVIAGRPGVVIE